MNCTQKGQLHNLYCPMQKINKIKNEEPLVQYQEFQYLMQSINANLGPFRVLLGPGHTGGTTWKPGLEVLRQEQASGKRKASEPLTLHEPCDSCFCEKQHPTINVMQQVMQRETVDPEDRVQSVKTQDERCRRVNRSASISDRMKTMVFIKHLAQCLTPRIH